jgi:hypothetical protein
MVDTTRQPQFASPVYLCNGPQEVTPPTPFPATIAGGATYDSGLILANGAYSLSVGATLSQAFTLTVVRYIDKLGTIQLDTNSATALAGAPAVLTYNALSAFQSYRITIENTSGSSGDLSDAMILVG